MIIIALVIGIGVSLIALQPYEFNLQVLWQLTVLVLFVVGGEGCEPPDPAWHADWSQGIGIGRKGSDRIRVDTVYR